MYLENPYETKGKKSGYVPTPEIVALTEQVQRDYGFGHGILTRTWVELNQRSVIDDENRGQLMFNAFVDTSTDDPNEAWKWRGTRSKARNKGIAMHAQLTSKFLLPLFIAQNENDDVDVGFSEVMRDLIEWMAEPTNSDYQAGFLQTVFGMMTSPVTYLGAEFEEVYQTIRQRNAEGGHDTKEVLDEVLSGFKAPVYGPTEILITNAYMRNIQRQRAIIKRRYVDITELEARFKDHPNWPYVKAGWRTVYNSKDSLFYDYYDMQHPLLVEEVIWYNRRLDAEVPFLGGIYMGNPDDVQNNPICHRDNRGAPKYNVIPFGYSRIGSHFFYFKSMMNIVGWDHQLYDAMTEIVMNRSILDVDQPLVVAGGDKDKVDSDIVFPKAVVAFEDPAASIKPLLPRADLAAGYNALSVTESSINAESIDAVSSGQLPGGSSKGMAYVIATQQANAKKLIDQVAKELAQSLSQYGDLMKDIAINHITLPEIEEITGVPQLKYKSFMLPNKQVGGMTMNKKIIFDRSLIGAEMTDEERSAASLALLEQSGWPDKKQAIVLVNPELFARFKYLSKVDIEEMFAHNSEFWQPILTNLYTMLKGDPDIDQQGIKRRLMRAYFNSEGDDLVKKQPAQVPGAQGQPAPESAGGAAGQSKPAPGQNQLGQMAQSRALSTTLPPALPH